MSRTEALSYREQCLKFRVRRGVDHLLDIVREVESEIEFFSRYAGCISHCWAVGRCSNQ